MTQRERERLAETLAKRSVKDRLAWLESAVTLHDEHFRHICACPHTEDGPRTATDAACLLHSHELGPTRAGVRLPGEGLEDLRALSEAATPGPWEPGMVWYRAGVNAERNGEGKCAYCKNPDLTLVKVERMDINGTKMLGHLHHDDGPSVYETEHRMSGAAGFDIAGNYDYESGGILAPEDTAFIVAAVNYVRALLRALPGEDETPRDPFPLHTEDYAPISPQLAADAHRLGIDILRAGEGEESRPHDLPVHFGHDENCVACQAEEPRAPQPDLRGALESVIRLAEAIPYSTDVEQAGMQAGVVIETARSALRATPVPASGLPSRDALAKALDRLARANRNYSPLFDSDDVRASDELNDALDHADAILATRAGEKTTP